MTRFPCIAILKSITHKCASFSLLMAVIISILLSACASVVLPPYTLDKARSELQANQFARSEKILAHLKKTGKDPEKIKNFEAQLNRSKKTYGQKILQDTRAHVAKNEWSQARALLDLALARAPEQHDVLTANDYFTKQRDLRLQQLQYQLMLLKGQYFADTQYIAEEISALDSTQTKRWALLPGQRDAEESASAQATVVNLKRRQHQQDKLVKGLITCGEDAIGAHNIQEAHRCLSIANQLQENVAIQTKLEMLKQRRAQERAAWLAKRERLKQDKNKQKTIVVDGLKDDYRQHVRTGNWLVAKEVLDEISVHSPEDTDLKIWQRELAEISADRVDFGLKQGKLLYSQGYVSQALEVWQESLDYSPNHPELLSHISRAEKFLKNLERLSKTEDK